MLSFSPEQFIQVKGREITSKPIKGTSSKRIEKISKQGSSLKESAKDRAENLMIVDLIRNDLSKVCEIGSVNVPKLFDIEQHGHLEHMVSTVQGTLEPNGDPFSALVSCFPGGSITGAPKKRAMEIIDELEQFPRSAYCGSMFYISDSGRLDSNILIRTIVYDRKRYFCWAGGGIVNDSKADSEYRECLEKVRHLTGIRD